jgi:hypothetical protein
MKKWLATLCVVLTTALGLAHAQQDWQIALLIQLDTSASATALRLITLSPSSVSETSLPGIIPNAALTDAALSPDGRWLAATAYPFEVGQPMPLAIYDLVSGTCCTLVDNPAAYPDGGQFELGGFSPDSRQLALSYVGVDYSSFDAPFDGGIIIVDVQTGIINQFSMSRLEDFIAYAPPWALMGAWGEDGFIRFAPNCYACEPIYNGQYFLWNPDTDQIILDSGEFFDILFSDPLPGTGEVLYTTRDDAFPGAVSMGYFPTANVVRYLNNARLLAYDSISTTPIVYFNPNDIAIDGRAQWIADGRAAVVAQFNDDRWFLFDRFGAQNVHTVSRSSRFIAATPDGWVAFLPDNPDAATGSGRIVHFVVDAALRVTERILTFLPRHETFRVVANPDIGITTPVIPFPSILPPDPSTYAAIMAQNIPSCPDTLASRLLIGGVGRVTPGAPNRLRDQPTTQGNIISMIPGGAPFVVLTGPVCDGQIVWWEVNYNGQVGYTAEIANNTYLVEPDNPIAAG